MLETFCIFLKTCQPARRFTLPPWRTLWVCSPVDVTAAKGARQEVCLTSWPSSCSAAKMKTEVTKANRRCGPSINHKLMSHRNVRNIFCCCLMTLNKPYRSVRCNCSWICVYLISLSCFSLESFILLSLVKKYILAWYYQPTSAHTCCITYFYLLH